MKFRAFLDSFSGAVADLTPRERTFNNTLRVLSRSPRVSTWDMSEHAWVRNLIGDLKARELIVELDEPYPWHRYALTEAGRAALTPNALAQADAACGVSPGAIGSAAILRRTE